MVHFRKTVVDNVEYKELYRYNDITKFITDSSKLKIEDGSYIYISSEEDYDIVVDLGEKIDEFENLKSFIIFLTEYVCELDNMTQRFNHFLYPNEKEFLYNLGIIYIDASDIVRLEYLGTWENTSFDVVFEYKNSEFMLKKFGLLNDISDDWKISLVRE